MTATCSWPARWLPIPEDIVERDAHGSVLSWAAEFNSDVLAHAVIQQLGWERHICHRVAV